MNESRGFFFFSIRENENFAAEVNEQAISKHVKGFILIDCLSRLIECLSEHRGGKHSRQINVVDALTKLALRLVTSSKSSGHSAVKRAR